jgi:hypothetical protein
VTEIKEHQLEKALVYIEQKAKEKVSIKI